MSPTYARQFTLESPEATARLAAALAPLLRPGDVLLLEGDIGAGKTHFARSLIQARLRLEAAPVEDVPSPTFTLVQVYDTPTMELWHSDLYRLTHPDEVEELGLLQAFEEAICLIEWPDRMGELLPAGALTLSFKPDGENTRQVTCTSSDPNWARLDPALAEVAP